MAIDLMGGRKGKSSGLMSTGGTRKVGAKASKLMPKRKMKSKR